jgi:hypothetical protein
MKTYSFSGILDGWKIVSGSTRGKTLSDAKAKFRKRFKGVKSIIQE